MTRPMLAMVTKGCCTLGVWAMEPLVWAALNLG
jgi:hypothetical protein